MKPSNPPHVPFTQAPIAHFVAYQREGLGTYDLAPAPVQMVAIAQALSFYRQLRVRGGSAT